MMMMTKFIMMMDDNNMVNAKKDGVLYSQGWKMIVRKVMDVHGTLSAYNVDYWEKIVYNKKVVTIDWSRW